MDEQSRAEAADERRRTPSLPPHMRVRDEDLEPHAGLRYIAKLFKVLSILLILLLVAEAVIGLVQQGASALPTLLVEATRLVVFAAFLWAAGDIALMLIESNHDLRALRIVVGRMAGDVDRIAARDEGGERGEEGGAPRRMPRAGP